MSITGFELAKAYEKGELCGWAEARHPGLAKKEFDLLDAKGAFVPFRIKRQTVATSGRKMFLHWATRKVLGKDTLNYPQEVGDCVSQGAKNGTEYGSCSQILATASRVASGDRADEDGRIAAARIKWKPIFAPYYYGTGRVYVGGGQLSGDGSLGSWMAEAVRKYGTLFSDEPGVPKYSGAVATAWGDRNPGPDLDKWRDYCTNYPVRSTALIRNWDDLVAAINNGYPCPTASMVGYNMEPSSDGFHRQTTQWAHQMCFIGTDETYKSGNEPYALLLNSWGDAHGRLKDFETGEDLPVGVLRIRRADAEKHIRERETYAYSEFAGLPEQRLDKALFKLI